MLCVLWPLPIILGTSTLLVCITANLTRHIFHRHPIDVSQIITCKSRTALGCVHKIMNSFTFCSVHSKSLGSRKICTHLDTVQ